MKKNILVFVILMSLCFLTSCDDKELKNNTENKQQAEIDAQSQVLFFCFTGNVIKERIVTKDNARELIEDNKLHESNHLKILMQR